MIKKYMYLLPCADEANVFTVACDISKMIGDKQLKEMGRCVVRAIVKAKLNLGGKIPGATQDFCEITLCNCTNIESRQIVINVENNK